MLVFQRRKKECRSVRYAEPKEMFCIFESIYFSNPRSRKNGFFHEDFRRCIGRRLAASIRGRLAQEVIPPLVVPVLDSGKHFAEGVARGLSEFFFGEKKWAFEDMYEEVFQRAHGPLGGQTRSFTAVSTEERVAIVLKKLNLKKEAVKGRTVVVVDDSIVRSNTVKIIVGMLKNAGAAKVIVVIGFPPIVDICPSGMDFQTRRQLIAFSKNQEDIRSMIGCDVLHYLSREDLLEAVKETYACGICGGCFGLSYPVKPKKVKS
jgi:amidophosphoribosyltransferase